MMRTTAELLLVTCGVLMISTPAAAADWPQWRGPTRDARVAPGTDWPADLSNLERIWRVELGPSYSGTIVSDDTAFVTETVDQREECVRALDRRSGKERWRTCWPGAMEVPFFARSNGSWIRSTPAFDGSTLFVAGMRDVLVALDAKTGETRWRVDFPEQHDTELPAFGFVSSPLVVGRHLYAQVGAAFVKIDKKTGDVVWKTLEAQGGMMDSAFSSPILAEIEGRTQLVVQTRQELTGVEPEDGRVLWRTEVPAFRGMNILTPAVSGSSIFTSTHRNGTYLFDVNREGDDWSVTRKWETKPRGYMSSPVLIDGHAYLHLENGRFSCIRLSDGAEQWRTRPFGKYWSMVANGGVILALNETGELFLIDADTASFRLRDRATVARSETWGHLAVTGREIFIREQEAVAAFRWQDGEKPTD